MSNKKSKYFDRRWRVLATIDPPATEPAGAKDRSAKEPQPLRDLSKSAAKPCEPSKQLSLF